MSAAYFFMIASIMAVISILIVFKIFIDKIKITPEKRGILQSKFFIGVAIAEAIPIILIVFGFMASQPVTSMNELLVPGIVIILSMAFAPFFIFLQSKVDVTEESRAAVSSFVAIGSMLTLSIPIISLVALFKLMPK